MQSNGVRQIDSFCRSYLSCSSCLACPACHIMQFMNGHLQYNTIQWTLWWGMAPIVMAGSEIQKKNNSHGLSKGWTIRYPRGVCIVLHNQGLGHDFRRGVPMVAPNSFLGGHLFFLKHECSGGGRMITCALHGYAPDNISYSSWYSCLINICLAIMGVQNI